MRLSTCRFIPLLALLFAVSGSPAFPQKPPPSLQDDVLKQARWRSIGPAEMGGRIADIAVDPKNPFIFYAALATGGLIKTTNNGTTWTPIFEHESVASVGAVAVAPSDSKILWVGTGEANNRNSSSWGDGVYNSTDGGQTWKNMGLKDSQEIARIVIDPNDANIVYVAATGHLWGPNKERGVYLTRDGGKTWEQSLKVDENTGAIDVALSAPGSGTVYAAMYQRRRTAWNFDGFGPGAGIYKSTDAGKSWKTLTNGLPTVEVGRIGLSVCKSKPNTVYAVIQTWEDASLQTLNTAVAGRYGGVFRSDDAGETWKRQNSIVPRGFYFGQIRVDAVDPERVYLLGEGLGISEDGGKTFRYSPATNLHADEHALWVDPVSRDHLILGTDGGLYASYDRGQTFAHLNSFPMGEFYQVSADNRTPFWVYGGLQDNGSWAGPSAVPAMRGPINEDWINLEGGDGFYVLTDPRDPDILFFEWQNGGVTWMNRRTNQRIVTSPNVSEGLPGYRFNWNTPLALSHFDPGILYAGGNRLFTFETSHARWAPISPDLSKQFGSKIVTTGIGAETYGTIVAISESPLKKGLLWCGTDDGNVQMTQDEGKSWTNLTDNLPNKVREYWVTRLEASHFALERAYLAIDGHRSDDFAPYAFVTEDFGKSWHSIVGDLPSSGPVQALREDPVNPNLLFCGTEFGAYASFDAGKHWHKLGNGLPTVAVDDLCIQPRDHALIAATHGRSLFVMDNIAPLEDLTPKVVASDVHLFPLPPGLESLSAITPFSADWHVGPPRFNGENPSANVPIVYWLAKQAESPPHLTITDSAGKIVGEPAAQNAAGLNRVEWDMRDTSKEAMARYDRPGFFGGPLFVKPGLYTVTLTAGKEKRSQTLIVTGPGELSRPLPGAESPETAPAPPR